MMAAMSAFARKPLIDPRSANRVAKWHHCYIIMEAFYLLILAEGLVGYQRMAKLYKESHSTNECWTQGVESFGELERLDDWSGLTLSSRLASRKDCFRRPSPTFMNTL
jgi:hypothetical protein